ncbi:diacylglycerol/lipid kinase family protein [Marinobacterium lutimaris]|uniref:Diacylglycerol kinase family enzyme n=1 Tax=Marinobacterium lutimaris TaxID=568106 RepID=A0A1H5X0U6_9GAMM|nr:diacylglycerol kinase family protein [Marinobacterium lutimaris]SEG05338.1 Diacylglycerol kinase family enzyme [Marinobacterium lutimaris]
MQMEHPQDMEVTSIHLVANAGSGQGGAKRAARELERLCAERNIRFRRYLAQRPAELADKISSAVADAKADGGRVVAMGGDGTIRAVAEALRESNIPLAVIPTGTFNFFARNLDIPETEEEAIKLAVAGDLRAVSLGQVNGKTFIINASFGLYARLIRAREQHTRRFGRHRIVAILSTLFTLVRGFRTMDLDIADEEQSWRVKSPMVFVGINALQLRGVDLDVEKCAARRQMGVVVMREVSHWALYRLTLRGLVKRLRDEQSLERFCADRLVIGPDRRKVSVVLDGERIRMRGPLDFKIDRGVLNVVVPETDVSHTKEGN